jgi:hypothetical protein
VEVTKLPKPLMSKGRVSDSANSRAVTRVNVEQASKRVMWKPTRLNNGEGRRREEEQGESQSDKPLRFHRGSDDGTRIRNPTQPREAPAAAARDRQPETREGQAGPAGVTERSVVAMKPGNAGGAKGP